MSMLPYLLIIMFLVVIGVMVVLPPVFVMLTLFIVLSRLANLVTQSMQRKIKEVGDAEHNISKEGAPEVDTNSLISIPDLRIQVPWWTLPSFDMYVKMWRLSIDRLHLPWLHLPECRLSCSIKAGFRLFYFGLIELFLFQIALPSFVFFIKFYLDIFFVLTIIKSFILAFPSFKLSDLPSFDFDFHFLYFSFRLPSLVLPFPTWKGSCGATRDLGTTLNLAAAVFTASAIITSDIMVALFDRLRRAQMIKKGYDDAVKAKEGGDTKHISWLQWGMKKAKKAGSKGSFSTQIEFLEVSTYFILWFTGLVMNMATLTFAELVPKLFMSKQEPYDATDMSCTLQMWVCVKIVHSWMIGCTCLYFLKVLSGTVHKDGIYILSAALTTEEMLCTDSYSGSRWEGARRLGALLWLVLGQFLAPMLPVGLRPAEAWRIEREAEERQRRQQAGPAVYYVSTPDPELSLPPSVRLKNPKAPEGLAGDWEEAAYEDAQEREKERETTAKERTDLAVYNGLTTVFSAKKRFENSLYGLTTTATLDGEVIWHATSRSDKPDLRNLDDFRLSEYTKQIRRRQIRQRQSGWCRFTTYVVTALTSPLTIMGDWQAESSYVTERCLVWQAQLESVHKATCFEISLTLLLIPLIGAPWCKSMQWLTDTPALLLPREKHVCHFSFFWAEKSMVRHHLARSCWCSAAFVLVLLRIGILGVSIAMPEPITTYISELASTLGVSIAEPEPIFILICALVSSALCWFQGQLLTKDNTCNSLRIAEAIARHRNYDGAAGIGGRMWGIHSFTCCISDHQRLAWCFSPCLSLKAWRRCRFFNRLSAKSNARLQACN